MVASGFRSPLPFSKHAGWQAILKSTPHADPSSSSIQKRKGVSHAKISCLTSWHLSFKVRKKKRNFHLWTFQHEEWIVSEHFQGQGFLFKKKKICTGNIWDLGSCVSLISLLIVSLNRTHWSFYMGIHIEMYGDQLVTLSFNTEPSSFDPALFLSQETNELIS